LPGQIQLYATIAISYGLLEEHRSTPKEAAIAFSLCHMKKDCNWCAHLASVKPPAIQKGQKQQFSA